jgi:hypothetical protein
MKQKRFKVGVLFPDGDVKWLLFGTPTKDGFVYGISHADTHITALPDTRSVSFHETDQKYKKWKHLGKLIKNGDYDELQLKALKPKIIVDDGLNEQVVYITRRGMKLLNLPSDIIIEKETNQERIFLLDLDQFFTNSKKMLFELKLNIHKLFGLCNASEILSNNEYVVGITSRETAVVDIDGDLYEMDVKVYFDLVNEENPLQEVFRPLGLPSLMPELERRFIQVIEKKKESLYKFSLFGSEAPV